MKNTACNYEFFLVNTGEVITELDRCPQCNGNKITQEKKVLNVNVEKGMLHGQKIVFNAEADEAVKSFFAMQISSAFCNSPVYILNCASKT